jgi:SAM-dependent methyltransferase
VLKIEGRVAELRVTLAGLDEALFASLFDPFGGRPTVTLARNDARVLSGFGLIKQRAAGWVGDHRIRRRGPRFYVMELGEQEYFQDVWPETDALLEVLERLPKGTLLDMGTGCGIVGIEAAALGHTVTATDLYDTALTLARFNAGLNGVSGIDFRAGHLFEPVRGQEFDAILTAPHYGRVFDQLRLETLRTGPARLARGGRLVLATNLEWTGEGPLPVVPALLEPMARQGFDVAIAPIVSERKKTWFARARGHASAVSRHRFTVTLVRRGDGQGGVVEVRMPAEDQQLAQDFVPLARLLPRATATVEDASDFARLSEIVAQLARGALVLDGPLPIGLLDSCRFGGRRCVTDTPSDGGRASAAILDAQGGVRSCTHAPPIGRVNHSLAELVAAQERADAELQARRGCAECSALVHCSRCQVPLVLDEAAYCTFMRAHPMGLERFSTLLELLEEIGRELPQPSPSPGGARTGDEQAHERLRIKAWAGEQLLFAHHRPRLPDVASPAPTLTARWRGSLTWVIGVGQGEATRHALAWVGWERIGFAEIDELGAEIGELIADDATHAELEAYVRERQLPRKMLDRALEKIARIIP